MTTPTTPMTADDVLAVLERMAGQAERARESGSASYESLNRTYHEDKEAIAAVAELIAAAQRIERKAVKQSRTTISVFISDVTRLSAAIARVGGAP